MRTPELVLLLLIGILPRFVELKGAEKGSRLSGFRILGFRVQGLGFRGLGVRVWGLGGWKGSLAPETLIFGYVDASI